MAGLSEKTAFLDVLDRCIVDVRAGRKTIEACLEENPVHRTELALLLPAAAAIVPSQVTPDPAQKLRARYAFVEALHRDARAHPGFAGAFAGLRRRLVGVAAAATLAVAGSGGAVLAAQDAQPSDPLYGLKTAIEQQQVVFAASPEARAQLRVNIADRRLAEAERAIEAGRESVAIAAASAYAEAIQRAYDDIQAVQVAGDLPAQASEAADDSLARAQDVAAKAQVAGEQGAATALLEARERAERDRPATPRGVPARPAARPAPTGEARAFVLATATAGPAVEPAALVEARDQTAPRPVTATSVPAATGARVTTPQPIRPPERGTATQGSAPERAGSGNGDNRENQQEDDRGRRDGDQGGARTAPQAQPTAAAPATAIRTATPRRAAEGSPDRDHDEGPAERGNGQGRGNDEGRAPGVPTQTPTVIAQTGTGGDDRSRATATPSRATPTPNRSGNAGDGERDRDRGGDRRGGDRD